jgi:stearoyl-CoA desaturase (delta-9 desaturase)
VADELSCTWNEYFETVQTYYPRLRVTHTSRNNPILALITLGSGWHNNHHHDVVSTRQGFFWWELDITYYALALLARLEIIRELRPVPEYVIHQNLIVD